MNKEELAAYQRAWRAANLEKIRAKQKEYYLANRDGICAQARAHRLANLKKDKKQQRANYLSHRQERLAWMKAYYATHKKEQMAYKRMKKYGMSQDDFDALLEKQGMACAICHRDDWPGKHLPHVDHDHKSGKIRGILCSKCNTALGLVNESLEIIKSMENYIRKNQRGDDK